MKKNEDLSEEEFEKGFTEGLDDLNRLNDDSSDGGKIQELKLDKSDSFEEELDKTLTEGLDDLNKFDNDSLEP